MHALRHRWMGVHRRNDVVDCSLKGLRHANLMDQLTGVLANDVTTKDLAVLLADNQLHHALRRAISNSLAVTLQAVLANPVLNALLFRGTLRQTNARHLRVAIRRTRNRVVVHAG